MATTYKRIAQQTLLSAAANIEFTSIPQTYTDLVCLFSGRDNNASVATDVYLEFNGVTTGYSVRRLYGTGTSAVSDNTTTLFCALTNGSNSTANTFSNCEIVIPNYAGSTNKFLSSVSCVETNNTIALIRIVSGLWSNTSAITSMKFSVNGGYNFNIGTSVYLYGITKA